MKEKQENIDENNKEKELNSQFSMILISIKKFLTDIIRIDGVDYEGTIESVKKDMLFRGHTAWILIFSIFIASIGLNANSIPIIIGAMLISPLMGPIVAVGLSIGTNDLSLFKKASKNLLIAFLISLITSTIYFSISPLKQSTSELFARTTPTILDVFIAFFGGFAGIIAGSRRERGNVIPRVAIATALMPPLCTAGYGLATWQMNFFFGAIYLFLINSIFISLATVIASNLLKFPDKTVLDETSHRRIKRIITIITVVVVIPSILIFFKVIKESRFNTNAKLFVQNVVSAPNSHLLNSTFLLSDTTAFINLYFIGKQLVILLFMLG